MAEHEYFGNSTCRRLLEKLKTALGGKANQSEVDRLSEEIADLELGGNAGTLAGIQSVLTDIVTFLKAVPFDDTVASASDLDDIQSKIDALASSDDENGETEVTLSSISAVYSGGDVAVGTALTDLTGITVTATYSDGSTAAVTGYTLGGEIVEGSNTIRVSYGGMTTTFTVTGITDEEGGGTTETVTATFADGVLTISGATVTTATFNDGVLAVA